MAKEDFLEGYGQGLETGKQNPVLGYVNKTLDMALGNPHDSAKRGYEKGYQEMQEAKAAEAKRKPMKKGGKVSHNVRGHGIEQRGITKGKFI